MKTILVAFKYFFVFSLTAIKCARYQFNRLISKIRLKQYFAVLTLFIVSLLLLSAL